MKVRKKIEISNIIMIIIVNLLSFTLVVTIISDMEETAEAAHYAEEIIYVENIELLNKLERTYFDFHMLRENMANIDMSHFIEEEEYDEAYDEEYEMYEEEEEYEYEEEEYEPVYIPWTPPPTLPPPPPPTLPPPPPPTLPPYEPNEDEDIGDNEGNDPPEDDGIPPEDAE